MKVEAKSKEKAIKASVHKHKAKESNPDDSTSDTDANNDANTDDESTDSDMMEMVAMIVKSFKKMKFGKARKQGNFQKRPFNAEKDRYQRKESKSSNFDKSKVRCYNYDGMGHIVLDI